MASIYISPSTQEHNPYVTGNVEEYWMNKVADALCPILTRHGITVYRNNPNWTLTQVVADSNAKKANIHFALHSNAGGARGGEVLCYALSGEGYKFAKCIYEQIEPITPTSDRGVKANPSLYELRATSIPSALVEIAFHDNIDDATWIINHINDIAVAYAKGICKYFGIAYVEETVPTVPQPTDELYRVRLTWENVKSQIGAYRELNNAKATADAHASEGYKVFNSKGEVVYEPVIAPPPVVEPPTPEPEPVVVKHMVMGVQECTIEQCETFLHKTNPDAPYYADIYKAQCESEGVRFDIAFAQSILETGYFRFNGDAKPEQNNFAGIGTTGGGVQGAFFATPEEGILAQAQHLKAYASTEPLNNPCVDPRYNLVSPHGKAPYIEDFGNGIWATSTDNYGGRIWSIVEQIKTTIADPQYHKPEPSQPPVVETPEVQPPVVEIPDVQKEGMGLLEVFITAMRKLFEFIISKL